MMIRLKIKKAILTTSPKIWALRAINRLGITKLMDGIWTGESDIRKPHKEAYLEVLEKFNLSPRSTLIVEDEPKNLVPAKELGMTTVLLGAGEYLHVDHYISKIYEVEELCCLD
jgi:putative hydrolase of the HAD superfamily